MTNSNDLIRRVDVLAALSELPVFSDRESDLMNAKAISVLHAATKAINAIPAAPDTPEVLALVEALRFYAPRTVDGITFTGNDDAGNRARAALAAWEASRG